MVIALTLFDIPPTPGVLFLLKSCPEEVDVHQMLLRGDIEAPGVCCCTPSICTCPDCL